MSIRWGKAVDDPASVEAAVREGFTNIQLTVDAVMGLSEEHYVLFRDDLQRRNIIVEVCTSPLPSEVYVTEMGFNLYAWTEYLKKAIRRIADLGCTKLAWSDGRSRVLPWEGDISGVKEQVLQFLFMLCDVCDNYGIIVLVEPLGPRRTNFLNSMQEVCDFIARVGKTNLNSMISYRELAEMGMGIETLNGFAQSIDHVQFENPLHISGKRLPPLPDDGQQYRQFLGALKKMGYAGTIHLPAAAEAVSLKYCEQLWQELP